MSCQTLRGLLPSSPWWVLGKSIQHRTWQASIELPIGELLVDLAQCQFLFSRVLHISPRHCKRTDSNVRSNDDIDEIDEP